MHNPHHLHLTDDWATLLTQAWTSIHRSFAVDIFEIIALSSRFRNIEHIGIFILFCRLVLAVAGAYVGSANSSTAITHVSTDLYSRV